ncbi:hypothetical protein ODX99_001147 [Vibrio alginolyticus]|nr:hypothetical protein [Vibrio alginolyticus]EJX2554070.1 hypothetical protein [Vibrio alginolyticus]
MDWVKNTKRSIEVLCCTLVVVYTLVPLLEFVGIKAPVQFHAIVISLTYLIPFLIIVIVTTNNSIFKMLNSVAWSKSLIAIIMIVYTAMSNVWASTVINEIFGVSASYFSVTQVFLTLVFFIVTIMKWLFSNAIVATLVGGSFVLWFFVVFGGSLKSTLVKVAYTFVAVILLSATHTMISNLDHSLHLFVKRVATIADFYPHSRCDLELYGKNDGVIFLSPKLIMVAKPKVTNSGLMDWDFPIKDCEPK